MIYKEGYKTIQGYECLNSCISNYLSFFNIPVSGSDIFFLGNGFTTEYGRMNGEKQIRTKVYEANYTFLDRFDIPYTHDRLSGKGMDEGFLKKHIRKNRCISLRVASECLQYHSLFQQSQNAPHFINVVGCKEELSKLYISDGSIPAYQPDSFEGWVDEDEVMDGWSRMNGEYVILHLDGSWDKQVKWKELSWNAMRTAISDYLDDKSGKRIFSKTVYGKQAILKLFQDVAYNFHSSELGFRDYAIKINYQWKVYGFLSGRRYILQKMGEIDGNNAITKSYKDVVNEWSNIGLALIKLSVTNNALLLDRTLKKVEDISEKENSLLGELLQAI